jgi:hypothetical protein
MTIVPEPFFFECSSATVAHDRTIVIALHAADGSVHLLKSSPEAACALGVNVQSAVDAEAVGDVRQWAAVPQLVQPHDELQLTPQRRLAAACIRATLAHLPNVDLEPEQLELERLARSAARIERDERRLAQHIRSRRSRKLKRLKQGSSDAAIRQQGDDLLGAAPLAPEDDPERRLFELMSRGMTKRQLSSAGAS